MAFDDNYGATAALRGTVTALNCCMPEVLLNLAAPGCDASISPFERCVDLKIPIEMSYVGALPKLQSRIWNSCMLAAGKTSVRRHAHAEALEVLAKSDVVHVNSLTLAWTRRFLGSLGPYKPRFVCHIRELVRPPVSPRLRRDLMKMDGLVFIDEETRAALLRQVPELSRIVQIVLPDLVDRSPAVYSRLTREVVDWAQGEPVIGLAGRVDPVKGFAFMCDVASSGELDSKLLMAGRLVSNRLRRDSWNEGRRVVRAVSRQPSRLRYLGEIPNLPTSGFYEALSVLVRADSLPASGLTVYEALARGIPVVLPGAADNFVTNAWLKAHADKVFYARPRDKDSYIDAIRAALAYSVIKAPPPIQNSEPTNNWLHAQTLLSFYMNVIAC